MLAVLPINFVLYLITIAAVRGGMERVNTILHRHHSTLIFAKQIIMG